MSACFRFLGLQIQQIKLLSAMDGGIICETKKYYDTSEPEERLRWSKTEPDVTAAYAELLTQTFKNAESPAEWKVRGEDQHNSWKMRLRDYYITYDHSDSGQLWCPNLQVYDNICVAAHIVPHALGYRNAGHLFGEQMMEWT